MNLIIDIGNTRTKAAIFKENQLAEVKIFDQLQICDVEWMLKSFPETGKAILSSTAITDEPLLIYLKNTFSFFLEVNGSIKLPFLNHYETKSTQGSDRIAAVAGAQYLFPEKNILVIDCGTAITFDFINSSGDYIGGNIAPGLSMRYKALHTFTGKLPLVERKNETPLLGKNTEDAIVAGVQNGMIFEIEKYIEKLSALHPNLHVILTGGDCLFFAGKLKNPIFADQNLILIGLNQILEFNSR